MHAVEKFDWRKGFSFPPTPLGGFVRRSPVASPIRAVPFAFRFTPATHWLACKARARLELKYGRPATLTELAIEVEMPEDKVTEALRFAAEPLSLSEPLREDGDAELGDVVEDRQADSPFEVAATASLPDEIARRRPRSMSGSVRSSSSGSAWIGVSLALSKRLASISTSPRANPPDRSAGNVKVASPKFCTVPGTSWPSQTSAE